MQQESHEGSGLVYPFIHTLGAMDAGMSGIPAPLRSFIPLIAIGGLFVALFFGLLFPIVALFVLTRAKVAAAYTAYEKALSRTTSAL